LNSWWNGAKLYIDGELKDRDKTFLALSKQVLMSANLKEVGILEIIPLSGLISVEIDAYLRSGQQRKHIYSSHKRMSRLSTVQ